MRYSFWVFLLAVTFSPVLALAMPGQGAPQGGVADGPPHMMMGKDTGLLEGFLFTQDSGGKRKPVTNQTVAIIVYQGGQQVLTLEKKSDDKGSFQFKNILKDPQFTYEIGTAYQEKIYLYPNIQLKAAEKTIKVDFLIGEGSPYEIQVDKMMAAPQTGGGQAMGGMPPTAQHAPHPVDPHWFDPFKYLIYGQCAVVLVLALYFYNQQKRTVDKKGS